MNDCEGTELKIGDEVAVWQSQYGGTIVARRIVCGFTDKRIKVGLHVDTQYPTLYKSHGVIKMKDGPQYVDKSIAAAPAIAAIPE